MSHANARTTVFARRLMVERVAADGYGRVTMFRTERRSAPPLGRWYR